MQKFKNFSFTTLLLMLVLFCLSTSFYLALITASAFYNFCFLIILAYMWYIRAFQVLILYHKYSTKASISNWKFLSLLLRSIHEKESSFGQIKFFETGLRGWRLLYHLRISFLGSEGYFSPKVGWRMEKGGRYHHAICDFWDSRVQ